MDITAKLLFMAGVFTGNFVVYTLGGDWKKGLFIGIFSAIFTFPILLFS